MIILPSSYDLPNNPLIGWHNVLTQSNVSADQAASTAPVTQLANPATFNPWRGTSAIEQSVAVTLDEAQSINYIGMAAHNLGAAGISYHVEYSDNGSDWTAADVEQAPTDDSVILHVFEEVSAQFWRIRFEAGDAPPSLAVLYIGSVLQVPRRIYVGHTPLPLGRSTDLRTGRSENGQFLGRVVKRRLYSCDVAFNNLDPEWYRTFFDPFAQNAEDFPFFFGWRPESYPAEVGYAWAMRDIIPTNQRSNGMMEVAFPIQGITGTTPATSILSSS